MLNEYKAEETAKNLEDNSVITVGKLFVYPGSMNVIPGTVELYFDIRSATFKSLNQAIHEVKATIANICAKRELFSEVEQISFLPPVTLSSGLQKMNEEVAVELKVPFHHLYSGAGHDAKNMTHITDVALLFVPSQNGISHSPEESTSLSDIEAAALVLGETLLRISL